MFCRSQIRINAIATEIIEEAFRREVSPQVVIDQIKSSIANKLACVEVANPASRTDAIDALLYSMSDAASTYRVYAMGEWGDSHANNQSAVPHPSKIIYSGNRTIVFWPDGTKTIAKCDEGQEYDEYLGFVAAFAKKMFGSTSSIKKMIERIRTSQSKKSVKNNPNSDTPDGNIC